MNFTEFLLVIVILCLVFLIYKIREIIMRILIIDVRLRMLESLVLNGKPLEKNYQDFYESFFGSMYYKTYDKIVKFGRRYELHLPIRSTKETVRTKK